MARSEESGEKKRKDVRALCKAFPGPASPKALSVQIERVLSHLLSPEEFNTLSQGEDIIRVFRSRGLIPPCLLELGPGQAGAEGLAVCFAACIFPGRAYALQGQLPRRWDSFLSALSDADIVDFVCKHQLAGVEAEERELFLSDLCAADWTRRPGGAGATEIQNERRMGAILFLATWPRRDVEQMLANWRDDGTLLQLIRKSLSTSPSQTVEAAGCKWRRWDDLPEILIAQTEPDPAVRGEVGRAVLLERHVWRRLRQLPIPELSHALLVQMAAGCWETYWEKLISGFPYYAFRSHFGWWWRRCAGRWLVSLVDWLQQGQNIADYGKWGVGPDARPTGGSRCDVLTPKELLFFREGYRLVRSTFFGLGDVGETDLQRRVVDDLWYRRIERQLTAADEPEMVREIAERYRDQGITGATVNNLNRRLRLRMWAYTLARQKRWSNQQIIGARLVSEEHGVQHPFQDQTNRAGVFTIACLARTALEDQMLFWPFTAHRILHPLVDPQHPDGWDFRSYLAEVWCWLMAGSLQRAGAGQRLDRSPVEALAAKELRQEPLYALISELRELSSSESVQSFEQGAGRGLVDRAEATVRACCERLTGSRIFSPPGIGKRIEVFRKMADQHWIVPVWYLAVIEKLGSQETLRRLRVEPVDALSVLQLFAEVTKQQPVAVEGIMNCDEGKKTIARYLLGVCVPPECLGEAIRAAQSDRAYVEYLHEEMGAGGWVSPCEILQSRLDEFAEMTPEERKVEMPESAEHLRDCPFCQEAYRQIMPVWVTDRPAARPSKKEAIRRLAEPIVLTPGSAGQMLYRAGPPMVEQAAVVGAAAAAGPEEQRGEWCEWSLPDEETGISVWLRIGTRKSGEIKVECALKQEDGSRVDPHQVRIQVKTRPEGRLAMAGPLSIIDSIARLTSGSWTVYLSTTIGGSIRTWEVPLSFEPCSHEQTD